MLRTTSPVKEWLRPTRLFTGLLLVGVVVTSACSGAAASGSSSDTATSTAAATISSSAGAQHVTVTVGNSMSFDPGLAGPAIGAVVGMIWRIRPSRTAAQLDRLAGDGAGFWQTERNRGGG